MKKLQQNKRIKPVQTEQLQHNHKNIYQLVDLCGVSSTIKIQWAYTMWIYNYTVWCENMGWGMRMLDNWSTKKIQIASPEKKNLIVQLTGFLMSVGEFSFPFKVLPGRSGHHLSTYDEANVKNIGNEWYIWDHGFKGFKFWSNIHSLKKRRCKCCFCNYKLFSFVRTAFFSSFSLHTIAKIASITVRIIALLDFISTFQYMIHFI